MTKRDFETFIKISKSEYKKDKMRANGFTEEEANKIVAEDFERFLPNGFESEDNFFFKVLKNETQIGYLWYLIRGASNNRKAFIADILIYEEFRGKGFGKKTMLLLEEEVKRQDLKHIGLHVFGYNEKAIKLYQSLNYQTTDLVMEKEI